MFFIGLLFIANLLSKPSLQYISAKEKVTHESSVREVIILLSGINLCDVAEEVENTARVAPLIVVP
jgi:hypothetical protein